jgi:site-specific DNA-cytosine methylase
MKVLIGCEFSGECRRAFRARGHDAWSCDLHMSEDHSPYHIQWDLRKTLLREPWDALIAFPPCTYLAASGARWWPSKREQQANAVEFVKWIYDQPIPLISIENPVGCLSRLWRKPDQIVQPWWFGHGETKATCLWLKGLPLLNPTNPVDGREARVHHVSPSKNRWRERSRTLPGFAQAMAEQWG